MILKKALGKADDAYDGMKALNNAGDGDIAKRTDNIRDLSQAEKGGRDVLEEVTQRLMKSGYDVMQNISYCSNIRRRVKLL